MSSLPSTGAGGSDSKVRVLHGALVVKDNNNVCLSFTPSSSPLSTASYVAVHPNEDI